MILALLPEDLLIMVNLDLKSLEFRSWIFPFSVVSIEEESFILDFSIVVGVEKDANLLLEVDFVDMEVTVDATEEEFFLDVVVEDVVVEDVVVGGIVDILEDTVGAVIEEVVDAVPSWEVYDSFWETLWFP